MWVLILTLITTKSTAISQAEFGYQASCEKAGEEWVKSVKANWQDRVEVIAICARK